MGAKLLMSTSFHPQTDGVTERANCLVGQLFRAAISPDQKDWVYKIPMMEFAINASISKSTGFTKRYPAEESETQGSPGKARLAGF